MELHLKMLETFIRKNSRLSLTCEHIFLEIIVENIRNCHRNDEIMYLGMSVILDHISDFAEYLIWQRAGADPTSGCAVDVRISALQK